MGRKDANCAIPPRREAVPVARVVVLARQSLTRDDSTSIGTQVRVLTAKHEDQGDRVVAVLRAEDTRGWQERRDDLDEAKARAARREYDVLAAWSIDRLARSVRVLETLVHELAAHGVAIACHTEPWAADPFARQIAG